MFQNVIFQILKVAAVVTRIFEVKSRRFCLDVRQPECGCRGFRCGGCRMRRCSRRERRRSSRRPGRRRNSCWSESSAPTRRRYSNTSIFVQSITGLMQLITGLQAWATFSSWFRSCGSGLLELHGSSVQSLQLHFTSLLVALTWCDHMTEWVDMSPCSKTVLKHVAFIYRFSFS